MTPAFKPILATDFEQDKLRYPGLLSPKLDGIRAINIGGILFSRSMKPIPNQYVQDLFSLYYGLDGELIVGDPTDKDCYRNTNSGVMSRSGQPDVKFYVFDHIADQSLPFTARLEAAAAVIEKANDPRLVLVEHHEATDEQSLLALEELWLDKGYEGAMWRDPLGLYKQGRATVRSGELLKIKRFHDAEAEIIGFVEQMKNTNEATVNELGYTKRSAHKDGMVGKGTLGALVVRDMESGIQFNIGTGMDDALRQEIWSRRSMYECKIVKYKSFKIGVKDLPRFPVFLGFRDPIDMGE